MRSPPPSPAACPGPSSRQRPRRASPLAAMHTCTMEQVYTHIARMITVTEVSPRLCRAGGHTHTRTKKTAALACSAPAWSWCVTRPVIAARLRCDNTPDTYTYIMPILCHSNRWAGSDQEQVGGHKRPSPQTLIIYQEQRAPQTPIIHQEQRGRIRPRAGRSVREGGEGIRGCSVV